MITDGTYWNLQKTRSYNAIFNFIIGARGTGKTYTSLCYCVKKWLDNRGTDHPWQFIYVRRYESELDNLTHSAKGTGKLFNDIAKEFPSHKLEAKNDVLLCDGEEMGCAIALTKAYSLKSFPYPFVHTVIFEEFIITKGKNPYLKGECEVMLDLHITIDRYQNRTTWFFLGNNTSTADVNPYFAYFSCETPPVNTRKLYGNDKQVLVESVAPKKLQSKVKESRFGQLIADTAYGSYAIENKTLGSNDAFIKKKSATCNYYLGFIYYDSIIGVWVDYRNGCFYVSEDYIKTEHNLYAATTEDQQPNTMIFKHTRSPFIKRLLDAYKSGLVYYESNKLRSKFLDIMRMCYL